MVLITVHWWSTLVSAGGLSHDILTQAKKGGSFDIDPRKQIGFLYGPIEFSFVTSCQILPLVDRKLILSH